MIEKNVQAKAEFQAGKMGKTTLAAGEHMFAGLNAFEPGQRHAPHAHAGQDKLYVVLKGSGEVQIGNRTETVGAGDIAFAAAGVEHGFFNPGPDRLVVLAVLSPPPGK